MIDNILSPVGYSVTACMDGLAALKLLEEREQTQGPGFLPSIILLDVMMPQVLRTQRPLGHVLPFVDADRGC